MFIGYKRTDCEIMYGCIDEMIVLTSNLINYPTFILNVFYWFGRNYFIIFNALRKNGIIGH